MKAQAIKGLAVVSIADGIKVGYVDDVVFHGPPLRAAALGVTADGQRGVIPFEQIRSIGNDAVTIPSADVTRCGNGATTLAGMPGLDDLHKLKVVDEAGTFLGTVHELEVAPDSGHVTEVRTQKGGVFGIGAQRHEVAAGDITSVGNEVLVIPEHNHQTAPDERGERS